MRSLNVIRNSLAELFRQNAKLYRKTYLNTVRVIWDNENRNSMLKSSPPSVRYCKNLRCISMCPLTASDLRSRGNKYLQTVNLGNVSGIFKKEPANKANFSA